MECQRDAGGGRGELCPLSTEVSGSVCRCFSEKKSWKGQTVSGTSDFLRQVLLNSTNAFRARVQQFVEERMQTTMVSSSVTVRVKSLDMPFLLVA